MFDHKLIFTIVKVICRVFSKTVVNNFAVHTSAGVSFSYQYLDGFFLRIHSRYSAYVLDTVDAASAQNDTP